MAPAKKADPKRDHAKCDCLADIKPLVARIEKLEQGMEVATEIISNLVQTLKTYEPRPKAPSIQRVEEFNGESVPEPDDSIGMRMNHGDKIFSMTNAVKILPPNLIKDGRHSRENIEAIVGFKVDEEMVDEVYSKFSH